ncbi:WD40 repeat-like protein [Suillus weaverae]|nr:WD40 repeat-like protein [Suillus weaverae]
MPPITMASDSWGMMCKIEVVQQVHFDPEMSINAVYQSRVGDLSELLDLESREISSTANMQKTSSEVTPRQTMRGHTKSVQGVVPLPGGQDVITCSFDGSLRLWDLESGAPIGNDWRDERDVEDEGVTITGVMAIALSPGGKTIASGSQDGTMKLWDIKTGKVIARAKHFEHVGSMCWSLDGEGLMSGSRDGRAGLWMVKRGYDPKWHTGHNSVYAVSYSPDGTMIATSGYDEKDGIKIWDVSQHLSQPSLNHLHYPERPKLLTTIEYDRMVWSLAWTLDGKKLISGGNGSIRIFDTDTWQQIATLEGHEDVVHAISLFPNDRLLASASWDNTARIWDLDRNLQVGPSLNHDHFVNCAAFSADGKLLVTGCDDTNAYVWDVHAILKEAGLEDLLSKKPASKNKLKQKVYTSSHGASSTEHTSRSSIDDKSFLQVCDVSINDHKIK